MATLTHNSGLAQKVNRSKVLSAIQERNLISRSDLCEITGINPAQITRLTQVLLSENLIEEVAKDSSKDSGRKPVLLGLNKRSRFVVGIDFGGSRLRLVVSNMANEVIGSSFYDFSPQSPADVILKVVTEAVHRILDDAKIPFGSVNGVSVALGGSIEDTPGREVTFTSVPAFRQFPLAERLSSSLGLDVSLTSSMGVWALAEVEHARHRNEERDFLVVHCGYGIGIIPLLAGKAPVGRQPNARNKIDFGHITHLPDGPECLCGSRGCIEAYCGGWAMAREAKKMPSPQLLELVGCQADKITAEDVFNAAKRGDRFSTAIIRTAGQILGSHLAQFIQFYIPKDVIFSGRMVSDSSLFFDEIYQAIRQAMPQERFEKFAIKRTTLPDFAGALGAASVLIHEILHEPVDDLVSVTW